MCFSFGNGMDFTLSVGTSFLLAGTAKDDILYIRDHPEMTALAVQMCAASKRDQMADIDSENSRIPEASLKAEPIRKRPQPHLTPTSSSRIASVTNRWHLRFNHVSSSVLRKLSSIKSTYDSSDCTQCILTKTHKKPYYDVDYRASSKGELIHSDVCGLFPLSIGNSKYYVTYTDDLTRFKWVYTIPNKKTRTLKATFVNFLAKITNMGGHIQILRTDGGTEFLGDLPRLLADEGIEHQVTPPYLPQSNGVTEHAN